MITKNDLSLLYKSCYFEEGTDRLVVDEKNNDSDGKVRSVEFSMPECSYLRIFPKWLQDMQEVYAKDCGVHLLRLRSDCDAILFVEVGEKRYLIWIELNTNFNDVLNKAIYQLAGSYVRAKSHFLNFIEYEPTDYQELAIAVSLAPKENVSSDDDVIAYKKKGMMPELMSPKEELSEKFRKNIIYCCPVKLK